jgi:hypothetical protein
MPNVGWRDEGVPGTGTNPVSPSKDRRRGPGLGGVTGLGTNPPSGPRRRGPLLGGVTGLGTNGVFLSPGGEVCALTAKEIKKSEMIAKANDITERVRTVAYTLALQQEVLVTFGNYCAICGSIHNAL